MSAIHLDSLLEGYGLSQVYAKFLIESAIDCFESQAHSSGVILSTMFNGVPKKLEIQWKKYSLSSSFKDDIIYETETGAACIGLLLAKALAGYEFVNRTVAASGFDFWLNKGRPELFLGTTRIEISGIRNASSFNIYKRVNAKQKQIDALDAGAFNNIIFVIDFGKPEAVFIERPEINVEKEQTTYNQIGKEINEPLIKYLSKNPNKIFDLSPRKYEELIAELLRDMGYDIYLTGATRDGGRDIIAVLKNPLGEEIVTLVECKQYSPNRPVGVEIARSFLWTIRDQDKANIGILASTSYFTKDVLMLQKEYKWLLKLKDFNDIQEWLSSYGKWERANDSQGLWLPKNPL